MTKSGIVLSVENLSKSFGAVNAITDVSFDVYEHEVVALVGDNAAGKSTIARIISGAYEQSSGVIRLCGEEVQICSAHEALELGVATVFQDLALCENLDVTANIFLGRELHDGTRLLAETRMETLAREYLDELGGRIPDIRAPLYTLSGGQRQCVAIARTLVTNPRLLVLDEPTASLSVAQSAEVLNHIEGLRAMGKGVVFISHNLPDVRAVADRILVLRHGRIVGRFNSADASYEDIIAAITGLTAG